MPAARLAIAALAVACMGGLSACTATSEQPPNTPTSQPATESTAAAPATPTGKPATPDPASVDATKAEQVAEAVAIASVTWDTTVHTSEYDALHNIGELLTPELSAAYNPVDGVRPVTDAAWAEAREIGAYNVPQVHTAQATHDAPPDSDSTIYRVYHATWTWYGTGGQTINDPRTRFLYLTVSLQPDGRWMVSTFDVSDV